MAHVVMDERSSRSVVDRLEGDSGEPMVYVPDWTGSPNKVNTLTQKQTEKIKSLLFSFDSPQFFSGLDEFYPHQGEESILLCSFIQRLGSSRSTFTDTEWSLTKYLGTQYPGRIDTCHYPSQWNLGQAPKLAAREAGNVSIWPFKCTQQWDVFFVLRQGLPKISKKLTS